MREGRRKKRENDRIEEELLELFKVRLCLTKTTLWLVYMHYLVLLSDGIFCVDPGSLKITLLQSLFKLQFLCFLLLLTLFGTSCHLLGGKLREEEK